MSSLHHPVANFPEDIVDTRENEAEQHASHDEASIQPQSQFVNVSQYGVIVCREC
jgi:hypothetical protein